MSDETDGPGKDSTIHTMLVMLEELGMQVTALNTTVRALIDTHPDREAVAAILERQMFRMDALLNAAPVGDDKGARMNALLQGMLTIARRTPGPD